MPIGTITIVLALVYIGILFLIAHWGDRAVKPGAPRTGGLRSWIYPLSLAVYCTSWTFFGSVGVASRQGLEFLSIYVGPILLYVLCWPLILRIVRLAKAQNITSIADFIASRYGKNPQVAAAASVLLTVGMIPYVALQLKAVSSSLTAMLEPTELTNIVQQLPFFGDIALLVAMTMAVFAMLFGTRHADATEHQEGLMIAIATESVVKLVCFLIVGIFVTFWLFDGPTDLMHKAEAAGHLSRILALDVGSTWITMCLLSFMACLLLPRMFHVGIVESQSAAEVKRAAWLFPIYLVLINLFVVPIALAGLVTFPSGSVDGDLFVINLPLASGNWFITMVAFVGGLSASTAMVIVVCVALSITISNDLVLPMLVRLRGATMTSALSRTDGDPDIGQLILRVRRTIIFSVLLVAYLYYRAAGAAQLASIGLLAFAAVAQLAPSFFGALFWRRGNARGAIAGILIGGTVWAYSLLLPTLSPAGALPSLAASLPLLGWISDGHLFGLTIAPFVQGVFWSLVLNVASYILFSLSRDPQPIEVLQANLFMGHVHGADKAPSDALGRWRSSVTVDDLQKTVARYLGEDRSCRSFDRFAQSRGRTYRLDEEASIELVRYAEHLLSSVIGGASSRLVLSLLLRNQAVSTKQALRLLDDANAAMQYDRNVLQTALDHARQGISVISRDRRLVFWNRLFADVLDIPPEGLGVGVHFSEILMVLAHRGTFGPGDPHKLVAERMASMLQTAEPHRERIADRDLVLEIRSALMPDGAIVTTYTDITASVAAADELEQANERLEQRVYDRTQELTRLNGELARAKAEADEANLSKTRFLAAASHDILQPLNAARLYATSLVERYGEGQEGALVRNVDASLEAVEEILGALLDISRLDAGAMKPELTSFRIDDLFRQLAVEFAPAAEARGLRLRFVSSSLSIRSDRRLLRRVLQNLISNAIKYTQTGGVVVGVRRSRNGKLRLQVYDTGLGIPQNKQKSIFKEFQRLEQGAKIARGLGLGLSIVERIARILGHRMDIASRQGKGSCFSIELPLAIAIPTVSEAPGAHSPAAAQLTGLVVLTIDNEPKILDGMVMLLTGWQCVVAQGLDLRSAMLDLNERKLVPDVIIADYHLDNANGIDAVTQLRWRYGSDLPAVLLTADRSPQVRAAAEEKDIILLNKPLKPAALRALLAQWRVRKLAAE